MLARLRRNQKEKKRKEKGMINASEISKNNGINQKTSKGQTKMISQTGINKNAYKCFEMCTESGRQPKIQNEEL